eukprot:scaffold502_cov350-Pavlova_lutheri.AAC.12
MPKAGSHLVDKRFLSAGGSHGRGGSYQRLRSSRSHCRPVWVQWSPSWRTTIACIFYYHVSQNSLHGHFGRATGGILVLAAVLQVRRKARGRREALVGPILQMAVFAHGLGSTYPNDQASQAGHGHSDCDHSDSRVGSLSATVTGLFQLLGRAYGEIERVVGRSVYNMRIRPTPGGLEKQLIWA